MTTDTSEQLVELMMQTGRQIREGAKSSDKFSPYTALRLEALQYIASNKNPTMRDVAEHFGVTPPSATSLINGLFKSGAIVRKPDKLDRRITRIEITPSGRKTLGSGQTLMTKQMKTVFDKLSETERAALIKIFLKLSRIYSNV